MRVLTGLFRLTVLDLRRMNWAEDGLRMGPTLLATNLPHLRALDAPDEALVCTCHTVCWTVSAVTACLT